jgi:hypothetical protein
MRTSPFVSVPIEIGAKPVATATQDPEEENPSAPRKNVNTKPKKFQFK